MRRLTLLLPFLLAVGAGVVFGVIALGALGGANPVPAALDRPAGPADSVPAGSRAAQILNVRAGESRRIGRWTDASGTVRSLFLTSSSGISFAAQRSARMTCLVLTQTTGANGAGCNPSADNFQGKPVAWSKQAEGGPALRDMSHLFVAGVVAPGVEAVEVVDSAGQAHGAAISSDGGFLYEQPLADRRAGIEPVALITHSAGGADQRVELK